MSRRSGLRYGSCCLLLLGGFALARQFWKTSPRDSTRPVNDAAPVEEKQVRGDSLAPLLRHGQTVRVAMGYYLRHPVQDNDIVLVRYAGNPKPLIKVVRGLPGSDISLEDAGAGRWRLRVAGRTLRNSEGKDYLLDERARRMLALYIRDYRGVIPPDAYLVLGDNPFGSLDSTRFGLLARSQLVAKALLP